MISLLDLTISDMPRLAVAALPVVCIGLLIAFTVLGLLTDRDRDR